MSFNTVFSVIDGDTFEVTPRWRWNNKSGSYVRPTGYDAPELTEKEGRVAREKLADLILGKKIELRTPHKVDLGRLVCDVYFNGKYLADYFPEY